jgi:hypothetical protein
MLKQTLALAALVTTIAALPATAAPADFIGTWVNTDSATRGITKIVVTSAGGTKLNIETYGKCHPTDCAWGKVVLPTYGSSVSDPDHRAATANYDAGFSKTLLTFQLSRPRTLSLNSYTLFTDSSNRQPYYSMNNFRKL